MSDPQGWNGYAYARNNPLKFVDPDGRDYRVCDTQGKNCVNMNDQQYEDYLRNSPSIKQSPGRTLYNVNADGSWTRVGSATYFDPRAGNAAAFLDFSVKTLAAGYLSVLGPWLGLARTGTAAITVGLEGAAESAKAVALVAREVSGVVSQATAAVGNQSVQVTSRAVAEKAADAFVGPAPLPLLIVARGKLLERSVDLVTRLHGGRVQTSPSPISTL